MRFPFWRRKREQELDDEINSHLKMATQDHLDRGESASEAAQIARREFGNAGLVKEATKEIWGWASLERLGKDVAYAIRILTKRPGFTALAIATLALGIGTNAAIFSVINAVILQPLPFANPEQIVQVGQSVTGTATSNVGAAAYGDFVDWREKNHVFSGLSAFQQFSATMTGSGEPEVVSGAQVDSEFFHLLIINSEAGRVFQQEEDVSGAERVAVLSHELWASHFRTDKAAIGKSIVLDGISYRIIGVMPAKFDFPARTQVWTNLQVKAAFQGRQFPFYSVIGRLKRGVAIDQAQADMSAIAVGLAQAFPDTNKNRGLALAGWHDQEIKLVKQPILILGGAALFILLIACANVANLLLTALSERQREVAIRTVLGAGRLRIMRQLLTESLLLSGAGGLLGVIISFWVTSAIVKLSPIEIPYRESIGVNGRVLVFALLISMITGAVAGLSPIAAAFRVNLNDSLKLVGSSIAGGAKQDRLRNVLVIVELSLTMMLLVSAGLLIRSFRSIVTIDTGYNPKGLLTLKIELPSSKYPGPADSITFYDNLLTRIDSIKGVRSASCAFRLPQEPTIQVSARPDAKEGSFASQTAKADLNAVSPDYLASLEIPLDAGRSFTRFDNMGSKKVAIIDRGLAKTLWPNTDPIGQTIFVAISTQATPFEVVGVAGSTRSMTLGSTPSFQIYYPLAQFASNSVRLIVRPDGDPDAVVPALRAVISDADKGIPLQGMISMEERLSKSIVGPRFYAVLMASFAAIAILLSVIGLYGVISCLVGRRTHEIGIRMALGAERNDILKMVVFQGLWMVVVGLGLGLAGALAVTRFLRSLLFEIKPTDPATFAGIAVLLVIIALLASYIPARRASKVDPMIALRYE